MSAKKRKVCGLDISLELLLPGVAIVTGGRDLRGGPVMECERKTLEQQRVAPESIVNLLEYLASVPRNEARKHGLSIVVDARDTPQSDVRTLLDSVAAFHAEDSGSVHAVYVVGATELQGEFNYKVVPLGGIEQLSAYISSDQLTSSLDGSARYDHEQWIRFRFAIEPFLTDCSSCAKALKAAVQQPEDDGASPPASPTQQSAEELLKQLRVNELIQESGKIVDRLCNPPPDWQSFAWSPDFKGLTAYVNQMAAQLEKLKAQLVATSGGRKRRGTREYAKEIKSKEVLDNVLSFIDEEGNELLEQESVAESLGGAELLLYDITDFEETAKSVLTSGRTAAETILKDDKSTKEERDKATSILEAIRLFVEKLGERRQRLVLFREFHHLIDKAFSWSVHAARFLSRQEVAVDSSESRLSNLLLECQTFHQKHAALTRDDVDRLSALSTQLNPPQRVKNQVEEAVLANEEAESRFQGRWQFIELLLRGGNQTDARAGGESGSEDAQSFDFDAFEVSDSEEETDETDGESAYVTSSATASLSKLSLAIAEAKTMKRSGGDGGGDVFLDSFSEKIDEDDVPVVAAVVVADGSEEADATSASPPPDLGKESAKIKKRKKLVNELVETEEKYVDDLEHICKDYISTYLSSGMVPNNMRGKSNVLFGNVPALFEFNKNKFLPELMKYRGTPLKLGSCFVFFEQEFGHYSLYFKNMPAQEKMLQEGPPFEFFRSVQIRLNDPFSLMSYLIKPFQRMVKYRQFLEEIRDNAPGGLHSKTAQDLDAAIHQIKFQLRHGNDLLALDSLKGFDGNVDEQGALLLQDDFIISDRRGRHKRRLFLFEESILFSKQREVKGSSSSFDYKGFMKTADMGLTETTKGNDPCKFEIWFRRRRQQDIVILQAQSPAKKSEWVQEIHHLLFYQMKRLKEHKARTSNAPALAPRRQRSTMGFSMASGSAGTLTPRTSINMPGRGSRASGAMTSSYIQVLHNEGSVTPVGEEEETLERDSNTSKRESTQSSSSKQGLCDQEDGSTAV